jgi:DNA-binding XRE family transcriptional regulator
MKEPDTTPARVGQQLAKRREDLDLTQEDLGQRIGITSFAVSAAERGRNAIRRSKRADWERALSLRSGTISRAYRDGTDLELGPAPVVDESLTSAESVVVEEEDPQQLMAEARESIARGQELMARAEEILERRRRA